MRDVGRSQNRGIEFQQEPHQLISPLIDGLRPLTVFVG